MGGGVDDDDDDDNNDNDYDDYVPACSRVYLLYKEDISSVYFTDEVENTETETGGKRII